MSDALTVDVDGGRVRGRRSGDVELWRGIPFAAPVTGALRLRGPQPVEPWHGVRDATAFGADPYQRIGMGATQERLSEDALTVNVTRRAGSTPDAKPVLVFLYGGANIGGTSSYPLFGGLPFLEAEDIVYMTGNYRVGPLGFVDFSRYSAPGSPIDSNLGLRDQLAILEWVQRNIAAFGGDPANVTLAGQSAGALGVTTLMTVPRAAGLFRAAIAQSSPVASVATAERGGQRAAQVLELLGASGQTAAEALAAVSPDRLLAVADQALAPEQERTPGILSYAAVVDGDLLPEHPLDVLADGRAQPVPLLIGTTSNEGALYARGVKAPEKLVETMFTATATATAPGSRDRILAAYPGYPQRRAASQISGDMLFWAPSVQAAEGHSSIAPVWMYRYDYATPLLKALRLGATHGMDLMAVFGAENSELGRKAGRLGGARTLDRVSASAQRMWLDHATTHRQPWESYTAGHRATRIIDKTPTTQVDPHAERREAWAGRPFYR